ncbi:MAG TPA: thioesterase family protein [Steroidobacteraceae bacterium]|nr:thioesterase family protein [Steroidobacteraceae bacterium]
MAGAAVYETGIEPAWIDYNGHLRDAYYGLILSYATDAVQDRLGMDSAYRAASGCTLYTLELHLHYLREVKQSERLTATALILGSDHKRLHLALELRRASDGEVAASAELMLLHVHQGATVAGAAFPAHIAAAIAAFQAAGAGDKPAGPGSRRLAIPPPGPRAPHGS